MKTAIVYATISGTTKKAAQMLAEQIGNCDLLDISKKRLARKCDVSAYDTVIVGTNVRMGQIDSNAIRFIGKNLELLKTKRVGFFILNFFPEYTETYLDELFPKSIEAEKASFGAELNLSAMKAYERYLMKSVQKQKGSLPDCSLDLDAIAEFAKKFAE